MNIVHDWVLMYKDETIETAVAVDHQHRLVDHDHESPCYSLEHVL